MGAVAKVSVIVPVYNVEAYLGKCIDSCLNQTLYDIEIICVDDGSTDNSGKILDEYATVDPRIQVVHKQNGGLSSARNAGLAKATGEWIMFLDSDDYLRRNACERIWTESLEEKTDIIVFGTDIFPIYPEVSNWYKTVLYTRTHRHNKFDPDFFFADDSGAKPFVWRQAFSHEILTKTKIKFHEEMRFGEDLMFQFEIFPMAKNFSFIADRLYNYRWIREGSLMSKADSNLEYKMEQHVEMVNIITTYWNKHGLIKKYGTQYLIWLLEFMVPDFCRMKLKNKAILAKKLREIIEENGLNEYKKDLRMDLKVQWMRLQNL